MNLQQLEYIVAVDTCRHFVTASQKCFVTQATLSMMIKKLEDELNVKIFDRTKQPVVPTEIGKKIIEQSRIILKESAKLKQLVSDENNVVEGELNLGIIPTLAPYILPLFLNDFLFSYPKVKLRIKEVSTGEILQKLKTGDLDIGLVAIPLNDIDILEQSLFYEEFVVYTTNQDLLNKQYVLPENIDFKKLWLLEEGHCLRNQIINLCSLKEQEKNYHQLDFNAASIETLLRIVELNKGMTILPALAIDSLNNSQKKGIRYFKSPTPIREIGIVSFRYFVKKN